MKFTQNQKIIKECLQYLASLNDEDIKTILTQVYNDLPNSLFSTFKAPREDIKPEITHIGRVKEFADPITGKLTAAISLDNMNRPLLGVVNSHGEFFVILKVNETQEVEIDEYMLLSNIRKHKLNKLI